jgi:hypothetical protein
MSNLNFSPVKVKGVPVTREQLMYYLSGLKNDILKSVGVTLSNSIPNVSLPVPPYMNLIEDNTAIILPVPYPSGYTTGTKSIDLVTVKAYLGGALQHDVIVAESPLDGSISVTYNGFTGSPGNPIMSIIHYNVFVN